MNCKATILLWGVSLWFSAHAQAYQAPIGIPNPAGQFGAFDPIDAPKPDTASYCPGWHATPPRDHTRAAGDARDAYYIDRNHPNATDTGNAFGNPDRPRLTVQNKVYQAGDYIEIHGDGNPDGLGSVYTTSLNVGGVGTDAAPIWLVGVGSPVFTGALNMGASNRALVSYMIFDGIQWRDGAKLDIRPRFPANSIENIVFRGCVARGRRIAADATAVAVGASTISDPTMITRNIVFHGCEISHYGDPSAPGEECGVYQKMFVENLWILDSRIHDVAEDGIQSGHGAKRTSSGLYIGRCKIHDNVTNGIDLKQVGSPVVISESEIYGHWAATPNSTGVGENIVIHYAGTSSPGGEADAWKNYPEDVTVVACSIHGGDYGVVTSVAGRVRVIGNTFYNIKHSQPTWDPASLYSKGAAIHLRGTRDDIAVVHNTIYGCDSGIQIPDSPPIYDSGATYYRGSVVGNSGKSAYYVCIADNDGVGIQGMELANTSFWKKLEHQIWGTMISNRLESTGRDIFFFDASYGNGAFKIDRNLLYSPHGDSISYGSSEVISLSQFKSKSPHMANGLVTDPAMTDPANRNFTLKEGSPCIDAASEGSELTAYEDYSQRFGINIRSDKSGVARPHGAEWDIGAHEFTEPSGPPPPPAPTAPEPPKGLKIIPPSE